MKAYIRLTLEKKSNKGVFVCYLQQIIFKIGTTVLLQAKSDSGVVFCLQLLSRIFTYTLHLSLCESIDHLCIYPLLQIGLI